MSGRGKERQYKTFVRERSGYRVEEGAWESILVLVKEAFPERTLGVSDTSFWSAIEERALLTSKEACFQYYMLGIGHVTLAETVVDSFGTVRTALGLEASARKQRQVFVDELADVIYKYYPPKYKEKIKK
jgi:hypothetical protein